MIWLVTSLVRVIWSTPESLNELMEECTEGKREIRELGRGR